ncbi:MAG: DUF4159 domain-containing protein [Bacteroidetes bacterium]|jgi:hypothetical protein|nr:DUF4159 domain-containing protein [Bacteroidota bacterium]
MRHILIVIVLFFNILAISAQSDVQIALLKYRGGGDWYANPTSLPNLVKFCNEQLGTNIKEEIATVETGSEQLFNHPFVHMTGHGNVLFDAREAQNLRNYLISGGFLHIDDNYGIDPFVRTEMKKVFPELDFVELPADHLIYNQKYSFPNGLPKIHEHDGKPAQGFGLFWEGRLVCYYTFECDLGDGWEDPTVHSNSQETRLKALKMGANLVQFVFTQ